jgi:membrane protein YdbS with pleckstrin-like domain
MIGGMFCIKCGKENPDDAVFCQKCGNRFDADEETRVAVKGGNEPMRVEIEEADIFSISPTQKFVKIGYVGAAAGALLLVALLSVLLPAVPWWVAIPLGLALFLIPAFYHVRNKMIRYTLTDSKIEIDEGFIFQSSRSIPLRSIQDVSVSSTITQRLLGFGNLVIDNASEDGGKVILRNIDTPKKFADILLREMRLLDK